MKELDLLLLRYLRERWPVASTDEKGVFEALLELPDPQIAAWLLGHEPAPPPFDTVLCHLRTS